MVFDKAKRLAIWAALGVVLIPVSVALANSGPPPTTIWLIFDYQTSRPTSLEGLQLIECDSEECDQSTLLQQYRECYSQGCLASSPSLTAAQAPECLGNKCLLSFYLDYQDILPMKLVGQFSDRVRESNAFLEGMPRYGTIAWQVVVQDTALSVSEDERFQSPFATYNGFVKFFAFTVLAELLVATMALRGWLELGRVDLFKGLAYVLLANLVSYPVTWFFWPSLGQFQPDAFRRVGYFIAIVAAICAAFLVDVSLAEGKKRRRKIIITLVLLAIAIILSLVWLFVVSYGNWRIAVQGLPISLTILLAEIFAITFETALVYLLARKTLSLSLRQAALISLVMNVSSFLLGKLVLGGWL